MHFNLALPIVAAMSFVAMSFPAPSLKTRCINCTQELIIDNHEAYIAPPVESMNTAKVDNDIAPNAGLPQKTVDVVSKVNDQVSHLVEQTLAAEMGRDRPATELYELATKVYMAVLADIKALILALSRPLLFVTCSIATSQTFRDTTKGVFEILEDPNLKAQFWSATEPMLDALSDVFLNRLC
ncbi:hypothetical protein FRB98_001405 [Tulasnella sp. 332]|nr:hypothetical protein FRB98_001405 [Tulasnella sp. 332]